MEEHTQTRLFGALDSAFRDVPPSRIAGAIMVTDGEVHDVPSSASGFNAPVHVLVTGEEGEKDRRIRIERAPRFSIVGKPLDMVYRVIGSAGETGVVDVRISINGNLVSTEQAEIGREKQLQLTPFPAPAATSSSWRSTARRRIDRPTTAPSLVDGIRRICACCWSGEPHAGERTGAIC